MPKDEKTTAEKVYEDGMKLMKKSLFHQPEPVDAQIQFKEAAQLFTQQGRHEKASDAFEQAAKAAKAGDCGIAAACGYRDAANSGIIAKRFKIQFADSKIVELFNEASVTFQKEGKFIDAARALIISSQFYDNKAKGAAAQQQGFELFEQEGKPMQALGTLNEMIEAALEEKNYEVSLQLLKKCKELYKKQKGYEYKEDIIALTIVIIALVIGDSVLADQGFEQFNNYDSDEAKLAENLINSNKAGDEEALEAFKKDFGGKLALSNQAKLLLRQVKVSQNGL